MLQNSWPQFLIGKNKSVLQGEQIKKQIRQTSLKDLQQLIQNDSFQKESLDSLQELNVFQLEQYYRLYQQENYIEQKYQGFVPLSDQQVTNKKDLKNQQELTEIGLQKIAKGNCAVILLAGGDGRRLGFEDPKILYPVDISGDKTLIEIFIKRIKSLQKIALQKYPQKQLKRDCIVLYLVIQSCKQQQIVDYFEKNDYFGYKTIVFVRTEQDINLFDENGSVIFGKDKKVIKSSMGNGDLISALNCSILDHMTKNEVEYVQISGIDNLLLRPLDPIFLGFSINNKFQLTFKTVEKKDPKENVGIHGTNNKGFGVYEYIHMDMKRRSLENSDGSLFYKYAHLLNLIATKEALKIMCSQQKNFQIFNFVERPFDTYDFQTQQINRNKNCLKVEWFFMDYYQFVKNQGFLNVEREEEFQPIKQKEDTNTPEQAIEALKNYYQNLQQKQGIEKSQQQDFLPEEYFYDHEMQKKWIENKKN